jgi:AraC family transcriptional regulator
MVSGRAREMEPEAVSQDTMAMQVAIQNRKPIRVVCMRHTGPYDEVHVTWAKLRAWAEPRHLLGPAAQFVGISHDDPASTPSDEIRYDACLVTDQSVQPDAQVRTQNLAGGDYAVVTHRGPYWQLPDVYTHIYADWMPASGYEPRELPAYEVYRDNPECTLAGDLLTDVCVPIRPST